MPFHPGPYGEFTDMGVDLAGEMSAPADSHEPENKVVAHGDIDDVARLVTGADRVTHPTLHRGRHSSRIAPRGDPFGQPRGQGHDAPAGGTGGRGSVPDLPCREPVTWNPAGKHL